MQQNIKPIILTSFLRRSLKAYALKALIRATGCELSRIGRSRHWRLIASQSQLQTIINTIKLNKEPSWQWLAKVLSEHKVAVNFDELITLVKLNPNITLSNLINRTDCSIAMARKVLDDLEALN